jgi:hypothetical protein
MRKSGMPTSDAIHVLFCRENGVDARHKVYTRAGRRPDPGAGHDGEEAGTI